MSSKKKAFLMIGLVLGMCNSMIMQTLLNTALPTISMEFGTTFLYSWVHSGYILASSVTIPLFGKICDYFGYKRNYLIGGLLFFAGTVWCAFSNSMVALVLARVTMGIGAGIVVPATYGIIGAIYEKKELPRIFAAFAVVQIVSNGLGSIMGSFLTSAFNWRIGVWVLVPVELIGTVIILRVLPSTAKGEEQSEFKPLGAVSLTFAILLIMLGIELTGHLLSAVLLFTAGILSLIAFLFLEKRGKSGLLPVEFITKPILRNLSFQVFLMGAMLNMCLVYIPGCLQTYNILSAGETGVAVLVYVVSMGIGSITGGIIRKFPINTVIGLGWVTLILGGCIYLLPFASPIPLVISLLLMGFGCGSLSATLLGHIAAQAEQNKAGVNSFCHMIRNFGGSICVAAFAFTLNTGIKSLYFGFIGISVIGLLLWYLQNQKERQSI